MRVEHESEAGDLDELEEVTQPGLIGGILLWLDAHGVKEINDRQMNAVIKAATDIIDELDRPHRPAAAGMGLVAWLNCDDTGQSSLYMARALRPLIGPNAPFVRVVSTEPWPHDPSDFGRCVRLLEAVPELRPHLGALADPKHGPAWNALAAAWDELEALYRTEAPTGNCPKLYARMQELTRSR